ncbi:hypothetical protein FRB90_006087 [Tulasnella sp. 427]|nr:hypothetical protein FRB90_006087 [Tulasnella sp. 427]
MEPSPESASSTGSGGDRTAKRRKSADIDNDDDELMEAAENPLSREHQPTLLDVGSLQLRLKSVEHRLDFVTEERYEEFIAGGPPDDGTKWVVDALPRNMRILEKTPIETQNAIKLINLALENVSKLYDSRLERATTIPPPLNTPNPP